MPRVSDGDAELALKQRFGNRNETHTSGGALTGCYNVLTVDGSSCNLDEVVVLTKLHLKNDGHTGRVYLAPGASVKRADGANNPNVATISRKWADLMQYV